MWMAVASPPPKAESWSPKSELGTQLPQCGTRAAELANLSLDQMPTVVDKVLTKGFGGGGWFGEGCPNE